MISSMYPVYCNMWSELTSSKQMCLQNYLLRSILESLCHIRAILLLFMTSPKQIKESLSKKFMAKHEFPSHLKTKKQYRNEIENGWLDIIIPAVSYFLSK